MVYSKAKLKNNSDKVLCRDRKNRKKEIVKKKLLDYSALW
jgi:hypothetical protein